MATYIALIHKEAASDFGVSFPDFPGCVTAGATLEEARKLASEALEFHVRGMVEDGETVPDPSTLDQVREAAEAKDAAIVLVDLAVKPEKTTRINITIPASGLRRIDTRARMFGLSRSEYLMRSGFAHLARDLEGWLTQGDISYKNGLPYCVEEAGVIEQTPDGSQPGIWFLVRRCDEHGRPTSDMVRWAATRRDAEQIAEVLGSTEPNSLKVGARGQ
jgi:predicted RNase H-like HicB family nuclease